MTETEYLESPRAEPDFEAMDEVADFAVEHAAELSKMGGAVGVAAKAVAA